MQKNPDDQEIDTESTESGPKNREKPLWFHGAINSLGESNNFGVERTIWREDPKGKLSKATLS